jgi:hypothetical protein
MKSYRHANPSGVDLFEEDLLLIGFGALCLSVVGGLIYWKISQALAPALSMIPSGQSVSNALPGNPPADGDPSEPPDSPENVVGYQ